ncbi:MAG TPA: nitroreductase family protein [Candidatus Binataceae bacterium]|nr:nitroreductase family protein [Candidatus Binataceae bacterium]
MDAIEAITTRKAIRAFAPDAVEPEKLRLIINAGRHAMSARNLQPWQFVVIQDRDRIRTIGELCATGKFVSDAPAVVVVAKDTSNTRWADIDCAQAVQNMATAAWSLGLGTCWVGNFDGQKIAEMLGIPAPWAIFTILAFGYPSLANPPQSRQLKPSREIVHYGRWGNHQP